MARRFVAVHEAAGHVQTGPASIVPPVDDSSTFFMSAGIQGWRPWVLSSCRNAGPCRLVTMQWSVRLRNLGRVGEPGESYLTSFLQLTAGWRADDVRSEVFERMIEVTDALGISRTRLGFAITGVAGADGRDRSALRDLGIPTGRIWLSDRPWAQPFKPGPTGPSTFLFVANDRACGTCRSASCGCGGWQQIWHVAFLDHDARRPEGLAAVPFIDSAVSAEWLTAAAAGVEDVFAAGPLAALTGACRPLVPEPELRLVVDHARTVALIASAGVEPAASGPGHVFRRLVRTAFGRLEAHGRDPRAVIDAVDSAWSTHSGVPGFSTGTPEARQAVELELGRYEEATRRARAKFARQLPARRMLDGDVLASSLERFHAETGANLAVVQSWARDAGLGVAPDLVWSDARVVAND